MIEATIATHPHGAEKVLAEVWLRSYWKGWLDLPALISFATREGATQIVTPCAPTGPVASALTGLARLAAAQGITRTRVLRGHDRQVWPHATLGFFRLREVVMR